MKTIYLIFSFVFLQYIGVSQTEQNAANQSPQSSGGCAVIYSESEVALILKETGSLCSEVVFQSLPPVTQTLVPVKLALKKGIYSFKKDPELVIPSGYTLVIEDTMTGATYDFAKDNLFTFHVTRMVADRFVMFISKAKNSVAVK